MGTSAEVLPLRASSALHKPPPGPAETHLQAQPCSSAQRPATKATESSGLTVPGTCNQQGTKERSLPDLEVATQLGVCLPLGSQTRLQIEALPTLGLGPFVPLPISQGALSLCLLPCQVPRSLLEPGFCPEPQLMAAARTPRRVHLLLSVDVNPSLCALHLRASLLPD